MRQTLKPEPAQGGRRAWRRRPRPPFDLNPRPKDTIMNTPAMATRFARNTRQLRGDAPLDEDQMRAVIDCWGLRISARLDAWCGPASPARA
jgi:hypothetical protein